MSNIPNRQSDVDESARLPVATNPVDRSMADCGQMPARSHTHVMPAPTVIEPGASGAPYGHLDDL